MGEDDQLYKHGRKQKGMGRKPKDQRFGSNKNVPEGAVTPKKSFKQQIKSDPLPLIVRKQVDPETTKYFTEIANVFETSEADLEERSILCGNALEEARGKELELATDYILSHTMQSLLESCDVDHLCGFLRSCAKVFPYIAMDRSGSHVAETAFKSLAMHLQENDAYSVIEETLATICKEIVLNPVDLMCNCYGSHVLRSLLCLCKGVPLGSSEFHGAKSSRVLAERWNFKASQLDGHDMPHAQPEFPHLLKSLVLGMLQCSRTDVKTLQVDQYSSLVLQTALKLLVGHDQDLLKVIPILLGCNKENNAEGNYIDTTVVHDIVDLMKETAYSHLMEVILEVAPEGLFNEMFTKIFRNSLFELSSDHCGNFVVQALISHARGQDQMELIWEEIGSKFRDLLEMGKPGVIASLIAASQRLHTHEHKCCQALAAAVCSTNESPICIVPRILFFESYFRCEDKASWNWGNGVKMHIIGSLILQAVFKFESEFIQPYVMSLTSMEADKVFEVAKEGGGARVIEAFLGSCASAKQKRRLVMKLRGHFGELSLHSSGSFTIEKCFAASNLSLREAIAADLLAVRTDLSKTKQGPYLLRKLDIEGFANQPERWRSKQESKQSAYKEFFAAFGSSETDLSKTNTFLADTSKRASNPKELKKMRKEIDDHLASTAPPLGISGLKRRLENVEQHNEKYGKHSMDDISKGKIKKLKNRKDHVGSEITGRSSQVVGKDNKSKVPFLSTGMGKKRHGMGRPLKTSRKKLKA